RACFQRFLFSLLDVFFYQNVLEFFLREYFQKSLFAARFSLSDVVFDKCFLPLPERLVFFYERLAFFSGYLLLLFLSFLLHGFYLGFGFLLRYAAFDKF